MQSGLSPRGKQPAKGVRRRPKGPPPYGLITLWCTSLIFWLGFFQFPWPARLHLAYGSFLLWSITAAFIWRRKAPFLSVGLFLLGSWFLQKSEDGALNELGWLSMGHILWVFLIMLSSLSTMLGILAWKKGKHQTLQEQKLEMALVQVARLSSLGKMTNGICHEMKNQVAVIVGYLDQLRDDKDIPAPQQRRVERSLQATEKVLKILVQLRTLARDTLDDPLQAVGLNLIIMESINFLDRHVLYHGIDMDLQLANNLPSVQGDPVQLQTIFINLLNLSLDSFKGKKSQTGKPKKIKIITECVDQEVRVHFSDNATRDFNLDTSQAFDLSFHLDTKLFSHGLDLIVVQHLVQRQGGKITLQQDATQGMTAHINLVLKNRLPQESEPQDIDSLLAC